MLSGEPIPLDVGIRIFHDHARALSEEIECGNNLLKDAGTFLAGNWALRKFIRAEIGQDVLQAEIERNRILLDRLFTLLPEIIRKMRIDSPERAMTTFGIVYDACSDYRAVLASGRKEANRKQIIRKMEKLQKDVAELSLLLEDSDATQEWGFEPALRIYLKRLHGEECEARPFWKLQREIRFLSSYLELEIHRSRAEPSSLLVPDNQAKTHLVDAVYGLVVREGHPPFVTTPGSDFSYICSLLFEIATGKADESLAGAINRYSQSSQRAEADQHEVEYGVENVRARDEDNFFDIKHAKHLSDEHLEKLVTEARDQALSREARLLVMCELAEMTDIAENRDRVHGPFVMWADQIETDWDARIRELDVRALEELRLDVETGRRRRSELQST